MSCPTVVTGRELGVRLQKKNSSRWSSLWVLFLHTIARVVSEHHSNAPAFSTRIDYRNLSPFLLALLFSADEGPR
jgi:hypothetical protein